MKVRIKVSTSKIGSETSRTVVVDPEDFMEDGAIDEREVEQMAFEIMHQMIEWDWEIME